MFSQGGKSLMPKETVALLPSSPCPAQPAPGKLHRLKALSTSLRRAQAGVEGCGAEGAGVPFPHSCQTPVSPAPFRCSPQGVLPNAKASFVLSCPKR